MSRDALSSGGVGTSGEFMSWGDLIEDPSISVDLWTTRPRYEDISDDIEILEGSDLELIED